MHDGGLLLYVGGLLAMRSDTAAAVGGLLAPRRCRDLGGFTASGPLYAGHGMSQGGRVSERPLAVCYIALQALPDARNAG